MAEAEQSGGMKWWMGCGIGCAVILLILIIIVFAGYQMVRRGLEESRPLMQQEIREHYAELIAAGSVPAEHRALIDELVAQTQRPDAGTIGMTMVIFVALIPVEEGTIAQEDLAAMEDLRTLLENDPSPGPIAYGRFLARHPQLQIRTSQILPEERGEAEVPDALPAPAP